MDNPVDGYQEKFLEKNYKFNARNKNKIFTSDSKRTKAFKQVRL